jgi:hypothetical protein
VSRPRAGRLGASVLLVLASLVAPGPRAIAQGGRPVHGENATFAGHGVVMAWAVLRGPSEAATRVVLRIAPAGGDYVAVSVDGIDPFSQRREEVAALRPLARPVDIQAARSTFADLPRREVHLYTAGDRASGRPSLTVYFLGVPDTTPEFASEAALRKYLEETLAKLPGR